MVQDARCSCGHFVKDSECFVKACSPRVQGKLGHKTGRKSLVQGLPQLVTNRPYWAVGQRGESNVRIMKKTSDIRGLDASSKPDF